MRQPRPKIHLVDRSVPVSNFHDILARCGILIRNGDPKFMFSEESPRIYQIGTCMDCVRAAPQVRDRHRYEYGVLEAQESLNAEAEAS